jgi:hypothetical protein
MEKNSPGEIHDRWNQIYSSIVKMYEKLKELGLLDIRGEI